MMPQNVSFISLIIFFPCLLFSQNGKYSDYIVWEKGDTTHCNITRIERTSGNVRAIDYINGADKKIELRDKYEVSKVKFIGVNNEFFWEYLPVKAKKPVLFRHLEVEENGKIKIYANRQLVLSVHESGEKSIADPTAQFGGINRTVKLDNGKYLDITSSNIKKEIAPYLLSCPEFKNAFAEKLTNKNIVEAVRVYNRVCK